MAKIPKSPKIPLPGSERTVLSGARCIGAAAPSEQIEVTIVMRCNADQELCDIVDKQSASAPAGSHAAHLSREEFARRFSATAQDIARVATFAHDHGLEVVRENPACSSVTLSGSVAQFNQAFDVDLQRYESHLGNYRGRTGVVNIPAELQDIVTAVIGLDDRPQAHAHFRLQPPFRYAAHKVSTSLLPTQLASLYDFPDNLGKGQCIGIIELGGGYQAADLQTYFSKLGIAPPNVTAVAVNGPGNQPSGDPNGADGEVVLDIEIIGALAPEAHIVVYFSTNTDAGFFNALNNAVHDNVNKPSVISISWGSAEPRWTQQAMQAFNTALQAAAAMGVTVCVASGDSGSGDGVASGNHVDFPASSPYALACGGTRLLVAGNAIGSEVVWNDGTQGGAGGGGVSAVFALPAWQQNLVLADSNGKSQPLLKRGVPDVAGNADPVTGYQVYIDGSDAVVGGTSAVAPLWAALFSRINTAKGSAVGFVNPKLYQQQAAFHDVTQGNNGYYAAAPGWDACTGMGSPDGKKLASVL
ncbi:kumamolisin [Collimonas sp. OK307]|uniref:S53 family peptidase n=1 Tax=Collimonas sp. OK307 TaxID=1801620 RepID=UPI0008EF3FB3|nr:S53 family peptidase [Collimonas sp. OK307]SFI34940.1 kumamolisin [Collimonas sp. OK307]